MENPYEGSRAVPSDGQVPLTVFQLFGGRARRGAIFGAVVLGGVTLAIMLYLRNRAGGDPGDEEVQRIQRAWADASAIGISPLFTVPLLYSLIGAVLGAVLGTLYHLVAQLARLLFRRSR